MTIGIAASGAQAGKAVLAALRTAEAVCTGAIGGFVSAVSLTDDGAVNAETQNGGVSQLVFEGDEEKFEQGRTAGLISSGPNRPEPLSAFIAADVGVGLVTGHRLPNAIGADGKPMNESVLQQMSNGSVARDAVTRIIDANPLADSGLIAIDSNGNGYSANTIAVDRPDRGQGSGIRGGDAVWVLHNAVQPASPLAQLLVTVALDVMHPELIAAGTVRLNAGCKVCFGEIPAIHINSDRTVVLVTVPETVAENTQQPVNIGYQPVVVLNNEKIGHLLYEPFLLVKANGLVSADGFSSIEVPVGAYHQ